METTRMSVPSINKGYHYIRYAVFGFYLFFLGKAFDWLSNEGFPLVTLSFLGLLVTFTCLIMDIRNQSLWRKNEDVDPGPPIVTWPLYIFYIISMFWFLNINPSINIYKKWYPIPSTQRIELKKQYEELSDELKKAKLILVQEREEFREQADKLATEREEIKKARLVLEQERRNFDLHFEQLKQQYEHLGRELEKAKLTLE